MSGENLENREEVSHVSHTIHCLYLFIICTNINQRCWMLGSSWSHKPFEHSGMLIITSGNTECERGRNDQHGRQPQGIMEQ
jgi:hypothetical protein